MPVTNRRTAPATGWVEWQHNCPDTGNSVLRIAITRASGEVVVADYEVEVVTGGYRLHCLDPKTFTTYSYTITVDEAGCFACDCPDARHAPTPYAHCKHSRGLKAGLAKGQF